MYLFCVVIIHFRLLFTVCLFENPVKMINCQLSTVKTLTEI